MMTLLRSKGDPNKIDFWVSLTIKMSVIIRLGVI